MKRKALAFTIDAILALVIVIALIPIFSLLTARNATQSTSLQYLHLQSEDAADVLSKMQIKHVRNESVIDELFKRGVLNDEDLNASVLDVLGGLWATQRTQDLEDAANITKELIGPFFPAALSWSFTVGPDLIYNSTSVNSTQIASASRKVASGFARNQSSTGYAARAFLGNILGKEDNSYFFFGGFVGEGNLTATITEVPVNSNITKIYLEVNAESNFSMYVNGIYCRSMNVTGVNFTVDNWTITDPGCLDDFIAGGMNNFTFAFMQLNITKHFFGGGYLRVTYSTDELVPLSTGSTRYHFPGIDGLLNLYDSFYVPGNITSMNAFIRLYSYFNYTTLLQIGNTTILNNTGNNQTQDIFLNESALPPYNITQLFAANGITYIDLSQSTMPLRMLTGANITGGKLNGTYDIVLITDVSGSMDWRMNLDGTSGSATITSCDDPRMYTDPTAKRINVAKCLDKAFINAILGGNTSACGQGITPIYGNRVALVDFNTVVAISHNTSLVNGGIANLTYLTNIIGNYTDGGSTCLSCAINRAWEILYTQSSPSRQKYVIVMTDGQANYKSTPTCNNINGVGASNVGGYSSLVAGSGGNVSRRTGRAWNFVSTLTTQTLNAISMLNSTFGFAVANAGEIYFWNGAAWALSQDIGATNLRSIDILSGSLAFAGGENGEIYKWNGASWALDTDTGSQTWRAITIANQSFALAGTDYVPPTDLVLNGEFTGGSNANWNYLETADPGSKASSNFGTPGGDLEPGRWRYRLNDNTASAYSIIGNLTNDGVSWDGTTPTSAYLSFSFYKNYNPSAPIADIVSIYLLRPDGSQVLLWSNSTIYSSAAYSRVNISIGVNNFTISGTYQIRIFNNISTPAAGTPQVDHFFDGLSLALTPTENIFRWNGINWAGHSTVPNNAYSLDAANSTLALAGTDSERIYRWNGGTTWTQDGDTGGGTVYGVSFQNATRAFGATSNGKVVGWVPNSVATAYTLPGGDQLNAIYMLNSSEGYAVGNNNRIVAWNGNAWNVTAYLAQAYEGNSSSNSWTCTNDGSYDACGQYLNQSYESMNAYYSATRINSTFSSLTIDSVGFGPIGTCFQANQTLAAIANLTSGGNFSSGTNASYLLSVYCQIALNINTKLTQTQEITFSGNLSRATLYPESYIEFAYTPAIPDPGYKEVSVTVETDTFPNCTGSFFIPQVSRVLDAKLTSYSGNYWTSGAYLNSSLTPGFRSVYNLSAFGGPYYTDFGDPFHVYLPVNLLRLNGTNYVKDELGLNRTFVSSTCSKFNRVIYTARLKASTSYGNVFPMLKGKRVIVYYDNNHDGIADGSTQVDFGADLPLCDLIVTEYCFDPTPVNVTSLDPVVDAMDAAIMDLLNQLNYVILPGNSGSAGSSTNPIDIIIGGEITAQANTLSLVPNPWGPVDMTISVWA